MIKILSECCCGEVGKGFSKELEYRNTYVNVCEGCGEECDLMDLYCCDHCGDASEKKLHTMDGEEICTACMLEKWGELIDSVNAMLEEERHENHAV